MTERFVIYLDSVRRERDGDVIRTFISDGRGREVEVIACNKKFSDGIRDANSYWEGVQRERAEAYIATLPKGEAPKRAG